MFSSIHIAPEDFVHIDIPKETLSNVLSLAGCERLNKDIYWMNEPLMGEKTAAISITYMDDYYDIRRNAVLFKRAALFFQIPSYEMRKNGIYTCNRIQLTES